MPKDKNIKGENKKSSVIVITMLICIGLIAFIGITYQSITNGAKSGYVSLKPIDVTLPSGEDNQKVSIQVTLSGKSKKLNKLNMENVQLIVKETIKNLDYSKMTDKNGTEYIKEVVLTSLKEEFGDSVEQVSIENLLTGNVVMPPENDKPKNPNPSREEILKGFKWSKK